MHKQKRIIGLLGLLILCLSSCTSKRTNIIVSGHYTGVNSQNESISCNLLIRQLSEADYIEQNGKNVIKDAINGDCYSIVFTVDDQDNGTQQIDFINFRDAYNGADDTPISYVDDNDCWLTPFSSENNEIMPLSECYYSVNLNIGDFALFTYLYFMED